MITGPLLSPIYMVFWDHWEVLTNHRDADVAGIKAELKEPFVLPALSL